MYAIIKTGGKQYRVQQGETLHVESLEAQVGDTVDFDEVLMLGEGEDARVGTPTVDGAKVRAEVVEQGRGEKIRIVKFRRRKHHMKTQGHRQNFTAVRITEIAGV